MLQELTANTGASLFAIASTLFFVAVFTAIAFRVLTRGRGSYDARARLPLDDGPPSRSDEAEAGGR